MMVESEAQELSEDVMLGAVMFGHKRNAARHQRHHPPGGKGGEGAARRCRKTSTRRCAPSSRRPPRPNWPRRSRFRSSSSAATRIAPCKKKFAAEFVGEGEGKVAGQRLFGGLLHDVEADVMRNAVLDTKKRVDGRDLDHRAPDRGGSRHPAAHPWLGAVHPRRNPGACASPPWAPPRTSSSSTAWKAPASRPSCCTTTSLPTRVGETGRMGAPGRREIGHGKLAWRAIHPMLPDEGRVPLHHPRGVGDHRIQRLVLDGDGLRHLAGADGCGRSADEADRGHRHGPDPGRRRAMPSCRTFWVTKIIWATWTSRWRAPKTASPRLQMDIKIAGITEEIMKRRAGPGQGRPHAHPGRDEQGASTGARAELGEHAPRIEQIKIPTDKIREVIGTGGKVIREIVEKTGAKINIEDDGTVKIASADGESIKAALKWIKRHRRPSRKSARSMTARSSR